MPYVEDFHEFKSRMDCDCIQGTFEIGPHHWQKGWLFENGAFTDGFVNTEPPTEKFALTKMQRQFWVRLLEVAETNFKRAKQAAFDAARFNGKSAPTITHHHVEDIKNLQLRVLALRKKVEPLNEILAESPEAKAKAKRLEEEFQDAAARRQLLDQVKQIQI